MWTCSKPLPNRLGETRNNWSDVNGNQALCIRITVSITFVILWFSNESLLCVTHGPFCFCPWIERAVVVVHTLRRSHSFLRESFMKLIAPDVRHKWCGKWWSLVYNAERKASLTKLRRKTLVTVRIRRCCVKVTMTRMLPTTDRTKMTEYRGIITSAPNPPLPPDADPAGTELMVENKSVQLLSPLLMLLGTVDTSAEMLLDRSTIASCAPVLLLLLLLLVEPQFSSSAGQDIVARWGLGWRALCKAVSLPGGGWCHFQQLTRPFPAIMTIAPHTRALGFTINPLSPSAGRFYFQQRAFNRK